MSLVSVIIPTYRRAAFLQRAIQSVLHQTHRDLELIVVENGQSDDGKAVVSRLQQRDHRLRYLYQPRPDPTAARNLGIDAARGRYIAFLDNDDEWLPSKLQRQVAVLERDPAVALVACWGWWVTIDDTGQAIDHTPLQVKGPLSYHTLVTQGNVFSSLSSVMIRRDCLRHVGGLNARYAIASDYDLFLRLARRYRLSCVEEPLFRYSRHPGNLSKDLPRTWGDVIQILRSLPPAPSLGVTRTTIREATAPYLRRYYSAAIDAMEAKEYPKAIRHFLAAIRHDPLIGLKISWGRFANPLYKALRPYAAVFYCGVSAVTHSGGIRHA
jgi:glycosyltransferase involved in cell wall biosynthesis